MFKIFKCIAIKMFKWLNKFGGVPSFNFYWILFKGIHFYFYNFLNSRYKLNNSHFNCVEVFDCITLKRIIILQMLWGK